MAFDSTAYNPYSKAKKGETAAERQTRKTKLFSFQREHAQETGDQATTDKIYKKLGKNAPNVDADRGNKQILGSVGMLAAAPEAAGAVGARVGGSMLAGAARKALASGTKRMIPEGEAAASAGMKRVGSMKLPARAATRPAGGKSAGSAKEESSKSARYTKIGDRNAQAAARNAKGSKRAIPVPQPKALPAPKGPAPQGKAPKSVRAGGSRSQQASPRAKGTNTRNIIKKDAEAAAKKSADKKKK